MQETIINLDNQVRNRTADDYARYLDLSDKSTYAGKDILAIGGGIGIYNLSDKIPATFINYDLSIPGFHSEFKRQVKSIQGDFTKSELMPNEFDEVWALFSLPLYCALIHSVDLFFAKAMISLKPGGILRATPASAMILMEETISRPTTSNELMQRFYKNMNDFAKIGGESKVVWYSQRHLYEKWPHSYYVTINRINQRYPKVEHVYETRCTTMGCAMITKPWKNCDYINREMEKKIEIANAVRDNTKIKVITDKKELVY